MKHTLLSALIIGCMASAALAKEPLATTIQNNTEPSTISIQSAIVKDDVLTVIVKLEEGSRAAMNHAKYLTDTHSYELLRAGGALHESVYKVGRFGWAKFPAPKGNPETIDLYINDALPIEDLKVTYE